MLQFIKYYLIINLLFFASITYAQNNIAKNALVFPLNDSGNYYIQATFLNQVWLRVNENNPGTLIQNKPQTSTFDIGLRRTRMQLFGQLNNHVFVYFQVGQNNFNALYNANSNRKNAFFVHDAVCEYKVSKQNQLKLGAGLTIANGLSRFSQPSIGSILTLDVPVFAQTTVDQTDQFSRKLSVYARGQIGKFDYRFVLSNPFPITSSGQALPPISSDASFAQKGQHLQYQGYLIYQFFEHETHTTPYMTGTYLGQKKVWNVAAGFIAQQNAMWRLNNNDTLYQAMQHFAIESYLDMPINKEKKTAISAYIGYFNTFFGSNYLRYNGIMNPANGSNLNNSYAFGAHGPNYGNALPMFGTGQTLYTQVGYLLPSGKNENIGRLLPYAAATIAQFNKLNGLMANTYALGVNYLIQKHQSKISLELQNRPTFLKIANQIKASKRLNSLTLQYQIFF